eukprot:6213198-Pleurochrysis_carterae.AAC.6
MYGFALRAHAEPCRQDMSGMNVWWMVADCALLESLWSRALAVSEKQVLALRRDRCMLCGETGACFAERPVHALRRDRCLFCGNSGGGDGLQSELSLWKDATAAESVLVASIVAALPRLHALSLLA